MEDKTPVDKELLEAVRLNKEYDFNTKDDHSLLFKELLQNVRVKYPDLDDYTVKCVIRSQWKMLDAVIRMGRFESIRFKGLGLFGVKRFRQAFASKFFLKTKERRIYNELINPENGKNTLDSLNYLQGIFDVWKENNKERLDITTFPVAMYRRSRKSKNLFFVRNYNTMEEAHLDTGHTYLSIFNSCVNKYVLEWEAVFKFINKEDLTKVEEQPITYE